MDRRPEVERALTARVVPLLRERGFTGSLPHFRRRLATKTDLVTFQFDRHGGGFVLEVAEGPSTEFVTSWGKVIPASRLTAYDINPPKRKRLRPGPGGAPDAWFRYDRDLSPDAVAIQVISFLGQLDEWWTGVKDQPNIR